MERFYVHKLRHSFATRCIEAGLNLNTVSHYLGHADMSMTEHVYVDRTAKYDTELAKIEQFCNPEDTEKQNKNYTDLN